MQFSKLSEPTPHHSSSGVSQNTSKMTHNFLAKTTRCAAAFSTDTRR